MSYEAHVNPFHSFIVSYKNHERGVDMFSTPKVTAASGRMAGHFDVLTQLVRFADFAEARQV
jgi:uncharacterized protein YcsI (UPF0317 family)